MMKRLYVKLVLPSVFIATTIHAGYDEYQRYSVIVPVAGICVGTMSVGIGVRTIIKAIENDNFDRAAVAKGLTMITTGAGVAALSWTATIYQIGSSDCSER